MAANTQILANDTTHKQDNSIFLQSLAQKEQNYQLSVNLLTVYPGGSRAMNLIHTGPLYHMPELASWGLCPLLLVCVPITVHVLNKSALPRPRKRGVRGGFVNLCSLWAITCHSLIQEAEAKLCPCSTLLMHSESSVLGKAARHPGKIIAENRWPLPATIACSLAAFPGTTKRKKGIKSQGNHSAVYSH